MEPRDPDPSSRFDPAKWEFHVRRADGSWLARPAPMADAAPSNAPTWTRVISDSWPFDTHREARDAAIAHGVDEHGYAVIPAPRDPAAWLAEGRPKNFA